MSLETIRRHLKAKQQAAEPEPSSELGTAIDRLIKQQVAAELERQGAVRSLRRGRHWPDFDTRPEYTDFKQVPESPAAAPITPGDFSAVLEKNEVGRTVAITATSHGKRQRFIVQRDGRGRAVGLRLEADAHPPLPLPEHSKND